MYSLIIVTLMSASLTAYGSDLGSLTQQLVNLRADLETLNRQMESLQKEKSAELDLWTQKKMELESQLQKETLRQVQLTEKISRLKTRVKSEGRIHPESRQSLDGWITAAEAWVRSSLPFRQEGRLATLSRLRERLKRGTESTEALSAELWQFYEAELKMATDTDYKVVDLSGGQKAEAVRLGLYALYTRGTDDSIHYSVRDGSTYVLKPVTSESERTDIARLMQNMKAKKKSGLYTLPTPTAKEAL